MMSIRTEMPLLARHAGDWKGEYIYLDNAGNVLDRHASHLTSVFPEDGSADYHQTNRYTWTDGRTEIHQFPGTYRDGKLYLESERISGYTWEVDDKTIILTWVYKAAPENYLYEMIQLSPCGKHRARTWHWFEHGEIVKRTIIKEQRVQMEG
ncbi:MAG: DUF3598 domain-containing protein [Acidobacteria bacterium]|nr:DUF3598 domain-containing protein [Acidobacteriota bacterium]